MLNDDDGLPDDEEEILVYAEFDGSVASNCFSNDNLQLNMIGLDMEHPIMQVNGKFYEGTYQDAVGTYMFFEKDDNPEVDDPIFDATPTLKYFAKTRKVLKMNRIFVELKTEMFGDSNNSECSPSMEIIDKSGIPARYKEEALKSWEKLRNHRTTALNDYLEKQRKREEKRSHGIEPDSASDDDNPFSVYKFEAKQKKSTLAERDSRSEGNQSKSESRKLGDETSQAHEPVSRLDESIPTPGEVTKSKDESLEDPKPSTSKDSEPWHWPQTEDSHGNSSAFDSNDETCRKSVKSMHKATVQVTRRARIRKKFVNKKPKKSMEPPVESNERKSGLEKKGSVESSAIIEKGESHEDSEKHEIAEKIIDEPMRTIESIESLSISRSTEESPTKHTNISENTEESESITDRKRAEKQQKRDKKMRHIAEKLKKAADELRLKSQRPDVDG